MVHLENMVSGLSGRRHLAQIQNKLDVSMAHKKSKKAIRLHFSNSH